MTSIKIEKHLTTDLLIVGSGIAGLACAREADKRKVSHIIATKTVLATGASFFPLKASLGIQVTGGENDKALFQQDIERVSQGMHNANVVKAYVEESAQAITLIDEIGFNAWLRDDNRPACFAQHSRPIYLINEWQKSAQNARAMIRSQSTSQLIEQASLIHIATENNQVVGAVLAEKSAQKMQYIYVQTSTIILACGGIAGLYKDNLYPTDVIGSAHFLAMQAGAKLTNLEYIQFIPALVQPKYKVLFGEHTLKYCTKVTDEQGNSLFPHLNAKQFSEMMAARSGYAPFSIDFPSAHFDLTLMQYLLKNPEARGAYLHFSPQLYQDNTAFFSVYLNWLKQKTDIDFLRDRIAISHFAHSCNGGVEIDANAETVVQGLFAVGEVASAVEGANRLGGNSVGASLVFAKRALARIDQYLVVQNQEKFSPQFFEKAKIVAEQALNALYNPHYDPNLTASQLLGEIRQLMNQFANIYRTENHLCKLLTEFARLQQRFCPLACGDQGGIEAYYALQTALTIGQSMLRRNESRGAHYRADFPTKCRSDCLS